MTLLAVERIKLFTTRSPWWCMIMALGLTVGLTSIIAANYDGTAMPVLATQFVHTFGLYVIMVMAALAITTEYRFGTIKSTFQAVPDRISPLLAKTAVVMLLAGVVGEAAAFGSWGMSKLLAADTTALALNSSADWRAVAGVGLIYMAGAIMALGIGMLVRQTAAAVAIVLVFPLLVESLIAFIPNIGPKIQKWMPFQQASNFIFGAPEAGSIAEGQGPPALDTPLSPWGSLAYFTGIAVAILIIGLVVTKKRDA